MNNKFYSSILLLCLLLPLPALALKSDKDQPMNIEADRVDIDDEKGISTFRGNVVITRGSILIKGNVVIVYRDKNKDLDRVHATGKRAHFQQRPDNKPDDVIAEGRELFYDAVKEILIVRREGEVIQGGDVFQGEHIVYDTRRDLVEARGGGEDGKKGRVQMILQPSKKDPKK
ncbi:lipopolysaccharide transport periplasmic protein LptA [Sulfuriflexus mobilis]|uniref:lipopolysaccharide transport periplasmic protein LptA n=1 Tax=Sulfuriflexus mobilis TaxID=1811807 RepID=UPI0015593C48|nr:lipopolysaccharide transport periplasmic protein LptA [Sulfuriflexus mobilis]